MHPTHCFLQIQIRANSKAIALDALESGSLGSIRFDEGELIEVEPGSWRVVVPFSYPGSEDVAEGDLEDDIAPSFPALMSAKSIYNAEFEFHIVVGGLHADPFALNPHIVAMIAALGGSVVAHRSPECLIETRRAEHVVGGNGG